MFDFSSPLFWYRLIFLTELIIAEAFFTFKLRRRAYFALRVALSAAACYGITFLFPIAAYNAFYVSFMFMIIFGMTIAGLYACFDAPLLNIVFCAIAAYSVQHIAYEVYTFLLTAFGLQTAPGGPYEQTSRQLFDIWSFAIYIESYAVMYGFMYLLFGTRIKSGENLRIGNVSLLVISGLILLVAVVLNLVVTYRMDENTDIVLCLTIHGYNVICCVLAVFIQFFMLGRKKMQTEFDTLQRLHEQERRHYELFKYNVDYINVKCHDLKHQIRRIASEGKVRDAVISEIENAVNIYDSDIKAGNETLDIVLTEKRLVCARNGISFSCIVDGGRLDFMSDSDMCSLFGNALDNAIEATCRIEDREKRSIGLNVKQSREFVSVCVRNSFDGDITFDGDLPETTKGDTINHGYGMKSMRSITERYDGQLSVTAEDGVFTLNMLFPMKNS